MTTTNHFDPQALCSRKLWEIITTDEMSGENLTELEAAVAELAQRRHYLAQLRDLGKLGDTP